MRYSIIKLYENGKNEREDFEVNLGEDLKKNAANLVNIFCGEQFYGFRSKIMPDIKMISLCIPDERVYSVLYFSYGKFVFELRRGLYSPLDEDLFRQSYFKVADRFCESDLADYKDILLNVEDVDVATAMVTLRKCNCFGCDEEDIPRVHVDIACLEPAEGTDHRFLMDFNGSAEKQKVDKFVEKNKDDITDVLRKRLKVVR